MYYVFGRRNSEGKAGGLGYARNDPKYAPLPDPQPQPEKKVPDKRRIAEGSNGTDSNEGKPKKRLPAQRRASAGSNGGHSNVGNITMMSQGWLQRLNQQLWALISSAQSRTSSILSSPNLQVIDSKIAYEFENKILFKIRQVTDSGSLITIGGFEIENVNKSPAKELIKDYEQYCNMHENIYKNYEHFCLPTLFVYSEKYERVFMTDCSHGYDTVEKYNYAHDRPLCDALEALHRKHICLTSSDDVPVMEKNYLILFDTKKKTAIFASALFLNAKPSPKFSDVNKSLDWINVCYIISKHQRLKFDDYYATKCKEYKIKPDQSLAVNFLDYVNDNSRGNQNQNQRKLEENPRTKLGQKLRAQYATAAETEVEVPYVETSNPNETQEERINRRYALCDDAETADADTTEKCTQFCPWSQVQMPNRFRVIIKHHGTLACFNLQQAYEERIAFETNQKRKIKEIYKNMHEKYTLEIIKFFQKFRLLSIKETDVVETEDKKGKRAYLKSVLYIDNAPDMPAIEVNGIGYTTKRKYTPPSGRYKRIVNWFSKQQLDSDPQNSIHFERNARGNELFGFCENLKDIYTDEETGMHYYMDPAGPRLVPFGIYAALLDAKTNKPRRLDQQRQIQVQKPVPTQVHTQAPTQVQARGQVQAQPVQKGSFTREEEDILQKIVETFKDPELTIDSVKEYLRQTNLSVADFVKQMENM